MSDTKVTIQINVNPELQGQQGYETVKALAKVLEKVLTVVAEKEITYGGAWREQGWMGNAARVLSKTSRLKNMLWRDLSFEHGNEPVSETAEDLIAILGFFILNYKRKNKWGRGEL